MELTQQDVSPIPRIILFNVRIDNTLMKLTQQDVSTIVIGLRLLELNTYHGLSRCDITDISMIYCMSWIWFLIKYQSESTYYWPLWSHWKYRNQTAAAQIERQARSQMMCFSCSLSLSSLTQSPSPHPVLPRHSHQNHLSIHFNWSYFTAWFQSECFHVLRPVTSCPEYVATSHARRPNKHRLTETERL